MIAPATPPSTAPATAPVTVPTPGITEPTPAPATPPTRKLRYFINFTDFTPEIFHGQKKVEPSELKYLHFGTESEKDYFLCGLNSSLFFWFFCCHSDVRNVNKREILAFPCADESGWTQKGAAGNLASELMKSVKANSYFIDVSYKKHGKMRIQCLDPRSSKSELDEIDRFLGQTVGLGEQHVEFIINHDVKYRLGAEAEDEF